MTTDDSQPCRTCHQDTVYITEVAENARGGDTGPVMVPVRACSNADCPINNGTSRFGDTV